MGLAVPSDTSPSEAVQVLVAAGFRHKGTHAHSVNFRHPSGEPVQLARDPCFDAMIARAETLDLGGVAISIVRREDLIAMKRRAADDPRRRASKRLQDEADIALLHEEPADPDEGW